VGDQASGAEAAVEGFEESVVRRLARPEEVQGDDIVIGSQFQISGDELGSLIDPDRLRTAEAAASLV
jgi:hypothetical protein